VTLAFLLPIPPKAASTVTTAIERWWWFGREARNGRDFPAVNLEISEDR